MEVAERAPDEIEITELVSAALESGEPASREIEVAELASPKTQSTGLDFADLEPAVRVCKT